jgi:hypothetical protein
MEILRAARNVARGILVVCALLAPGRAASLVGVSAGSTAPSSGWARNAAGPDSLSLHEAARTAQARFERLRLRNASFAVGGWGGECDEILGRMCLRLLETGDWWPQEPDPATVRAREALLSELERAGRALPGDLWILAQRVYYLWEAGDPEAALPLLTPCPVTPAWWCDALRGFAFHRSDRFQESAAAFRRALEHMPPEEARRWTNPREVADLDGREALDGSPDRDRLASRFWALSDPLVLVPGNDRWTEHLSRRVQEFVQEDARNGYGLRWGDDLAEVLIRYGPELGWERRRPEPGSLPSAAGGVGHQHPEVRSLVAPGAALTRLTSTLDSDWNPGERFLPRSGYAPSYAPVILPADGVLRFVPRGDDVVVLGLLGLPQDTSFHADHGHPPLSRATPPDGAGLRFGLFALDPEGEVVARDEALDGRLAVTLPPGRYLLSAEVWAPDSARAGRVRRGFEWGGVPRDVPVLSDLLLADPVAPTPATLDALVPHLRVGLRAERLAPGETVTVAWELHGLGWTGPEELRYELVLEEAGEGILRRVGRFLGLAGDPWTQELAWSESGPGTPGPAFRATRLTLPPDMEEGRYVLRLEATIEGREPMVVQQEMRVGPDPGPR